MVGFFLDWNQFDEIMAFSTSRFGVVRIVINRATNRLLAVKAFNPHRFPEDNSLFANLMKQMSSLSHP
jgi:hypothetical protein